MEPNDNRLDVLLHRLEICSEKMESLDESADALTVKHTQKFISDNEFQEGIDDINRKRESVLKNMDKLKEDLEKLRN